MHFYRFIKTHYNSPKFIEEINSMQSILKQYKSRVAEKSNQVVAKTMRMTVVEFM